MDLLSIIAALLLLFVILLVIYVIYMSWDHGVFKKMGIPAPTPLPLFGNFFDVLKLGPFNHQEEEYQRYNRQKVFGHYSCKTPFLYIRDLDMIRDITVKHFDKFVNRRELQLNEPYDHMLTLIKDDHWKNVRNTVSPAFSTSKLRRMFSNISSCSENLVEHLREKKNQGQDVDVKHVISCYAMDVIASTGFGAQINSLKNDKNDFVMKAKEIADSLARVFILSSFFPFMGGIWDKIGVHVFPKGPSDFFRSFVDEVLKDRKQASSSGQSKRNDFLQLLMESEREDGADDDNVSEQEAREMKTLAGRKPLSYLDIQAQAIIFLMAGYETSSTALAFTLFLLAQNPDCCARLHREIDTKLGKAAPTYDNMQDMPYMDMCLSEAMRIFTPNYQGDRVCNEDIEIGGVHIPKGMVVCFPSFSIHRDPAIWPDPMTFDPERFSPENKSQRHPYAYLPWGHGPRRCVGMRLAMMEMKVALSAILQEMTPVVCSKTVYPVRLKFFQMTAEDGLWIKMADRLDS